MRQHRRTVRLARAAVASLAVLALAASGTAVVAVDARNLARIRQRSAELNQRIAMVHSLVARADATRDSDPRRALLFGIAAQHIHRDGETQADLVDTLTATPYAGTLTGHTDSVNAVAFAPDGHTLATGSSDNTVILWDLSELNSLRNHATERACSITQRGLDREEWARYVPGLPYEDTCLG